MRGAARSQSLTRVLLGGMECQCLARSTSSVRAKLSPLPETRILDRDSALRQSNRMAKEKSVIPIERIAALIYVIRGESVMLDAELAELYHGPEPEFASWAAICDGMKWPPAGSSLLTSRFGASSRHFSLLQKRILSMKRHRDEHDLGERWSWTHDEFDLLRNRTDSGPITT